MSGFVIAYLAVSAFCVVLLWRRVVLDEYEGRQE
jgi:hypothetical protein